MTEAFPGEGTTATVVVQAAAPTAAASRPPSTGSTAMPSRPTDFVDTGRDAGRGLRRRHHVGAPARDAVSPSPTTGSTRRSSSCAPTWPRPRSTGSPAEYAVGGGAAESLDFVNQQEERLPLVIGIVLLLTLLMMGVRLPQRADRAGLDAAQPGLGRRRLRDPDPRLPARVALEGSLDFTSPGFVIDWIPLFVMVVLVGLSMDYHVFVLSRVREHVRGGLPTRLAVERGIADTAGVVTSAAAVMVSVFAIFATLSMLEMKMMGVGLSAAILLDATLIRLVMLPAILVLLGERPGGRSTRPARSVSRCSRRSLRTARGSLRATRGRTDQGCSGPACVTGGWSCQRSRRRPPRCAAACGRRP